MAVINTLNNNKCNYHALYIKPCAMRVTALFVMTNYFWSHARVVERVFASECYLSYKCTSCTKSVQFINIYLIMIIITIQCALSSHNSIHFSKVYSVTHCFSCHHPFMPIYCDLIGHFRGQIPHEK